MDRFPKMVIFIISYVIISQWVIVKDYHKLKTAGHALFHLEDFPFIMQLSYRTGGCGVSARC